MKIRNAAPTEYDAIGELTVRLYSELPGFHKPEEHPDYYRMLRNIGHLAQQPGTEVLVAIDEHGTIGGSVVLFTNMQYYGSRGGIATQQKNAAGIRLLSVDHPYRGLGVGKLLTEACIAKTREKGIPQLILHTTKAMPAAYKMYEKMGFYRSPDLDFTVDNLEIMGFRYDIKPL